MQTPSQQSGSAASRSSSSSKPRKIKASSLLSVLVLLPIIALFFFCGVYVGSLFLGGEQPSVGGAAPAQPHLHEEQMSLGLPGTKNVLKKWAPKNKSNHNDVELLSPLSNLRGPRGQVPTDAVSVSTLPSAVKVAAENTALPHTEKPHPVTGSEMAPLLRQSLHAQPGAYLVGPSSLDCDDVLVGAWVYLDSRSPSDSDMRTILTNKKAGCDTKEEQHGFALYVNGWQTSDHKLYLEYGGGSSGCNKLDSGDIKLLPEHWYHVALRLRAGLAALYIDGVVVGSRSSGEPHGVQRQRALHVGSYEGSLSLSGNISHLAVLHGAPEGAERAIMDVRSAPRAAGLVSLFTLVDASAEADGSIATDASGRHTGVYKFRVQGHSVPGLRIELVDGLGGRIVTEEMRAVSNKEGLVRREAVKAAMKHAWGSYKAYAWGRDELKPLSKRGQDNWGGMGVTLVDSLDTLWLMGMKAEFAEARDWVAHGLSFGNAGAISVFETTIRELGGLLSAYELSKDRVFLDQAARLGDLLMPAFQSPSGIPHGMVNLHTHSPAGGWAGSNAILSELGTLQIEFRHLSKHTGNKKYEEAAMKAMKVMSTKNPAHGLFPIKVNINDGSFADSQVTFGALGDSFYEYLLKVWIQGGKKETWLRDMYDKAMDGVMDVLLQRATPSGLAFLADWNGHSLKRKMDHLVCFMPGTLALGAHTDPQGRDSARAQRDLAVAKALMYTCREMYHQMPTGIAPEYVEFPEGHDMVVGSTAPFYILRPETAESLFILNQLTGDPIYRDWAWDIFSAIEKHCRTEAAYGALADVTNRNSRVDDRMESFFLAETLKYLYLAMDPDRPVDLDEFVFNTEAHPTRIF